MCIRDRYYLDGNILGSYWDADYVENNAEWFLSELATITITANRDCTTFTIVVGDKPYTVDIRQKYTEEDMRKCFEAAKFAGAFRTKLEFNDYLKTL